MPTKIKIGTSTTNVIFAGDKLCKRVTVGGNVVWPTGEVQRYDGSYGFKWGYGSSYPYADTNCYVPGSGLIPGYTYGFMAPAPEGYDSSLRTANSGYATSVLEPIPTEGSAIHVWQNYTGVDITAKLIIAGTLRYTVSILPQNGIQFLYAHQHYNNGRVDWRNCSVGQYPGLFPSGSSGTIPFVISTTFILYSGHYLLPLVAKPEGYGYTIEIYNLHMAVSSTLE